ncbi:MATE family efflux transporter [Fusobacterium ulcerans]
MSLAVFGIILSVLITIFIEPVIHFLGGGGVLFPYVKDYMSVVILFCTCYMVGYALEIYIKVDGNPVYPAICVMTGGIINVGLDYLFVVVYPYGIKGAAFATGMSQLTSTSMLLFYILFKTKKIKFVKLKFSFKELLKISKVGFAEFLAEVSTGIAIFVFNIIILRELGEKGVSAFGIIGYISSFVVMTMIGFSQGIQPIVSFNLGAKKYANVIKTLKISLLMIIATGVVFYGSINFFSNKIISTFLNDTETFKMTKYALAAYSFAYIITGLNIVTAGYFTAVKKVKISTIITILRGVVLIIVFLEILPKIFGTAGIWWSVPAAELVTLASSIYFIKKYIHKYEALRV